jgi:uncharacterized protein YcfJ
MWVRSMATTAVLCTVTAGSALAAHREAGYVYARVVDVEPIVRYVTVEQPRRQCWDEVVYETRGDVARHRIAGQTIAGGIIGAAIGRQFGSGSGRDAMTLIGAAAGSAAAHDRAARRTGDLYTVAVPIRRCEIVSERFTEEQIDGYRVTYLYRGHRHTMRTATPPGDRVRLRVNVVPVGYR